MERLQRSIWRREDFGLEEGMHAAGPNNPLHGITLEMIVTRLQAHYGWEMLGRLIKINCFTWQPSIQSSLKFLRRTPWARQKVEELYLDSLPDFDQVVEAADDPVNAELAADSEQRPDSTGSTEPGAEGTAA
jgi:uncharacterized protein (DUF2132 family)